MSNFINNLIPYGTDMTLYYIGMGIIVWIIGLIILAKTAPDESNFIFAALSFSVICIFWPVLLIYAIIGGFFSLFWRLFGDKGR